MLDASNLDRATVAGFGREWRAFDQLDVAEDELRRAFEGYFRIFPWRELKSDAIGFDVGCGSGRWARYVAPRVGILHCVDASAEALAVARTALAGHSNCVFHNASVGALPFAPGSLDFGYSLGVLHHIPDAGAGLRSCVESLRPGAPMLVYVYYAMDNRPNWYRALWRASDRARRLISKLPHTLKLCVSGAVAVLVYWPLARAALVLERVGVGIDWLPLAFYRRHSLYTMRTDAYDRFCTQLERRFTAGQVRSLMVESGLRDVQLSDEPPFWCAVGYRS